MNTAAVPVIYYSGAAASISDTAENAAAVSLKRPNKELSADIWGNIFTFCNFNEFLTSSLINRTCRRLTTVNFPSYAARAFLRYRASHMLQPSHFLYGNWEEIHDIIHQCRRRDKHAFIPFSEKPNPFSTHWEGTGWLFLSQLAWKCGGVSFDVASEASSIILKIEQAYQPVRDLLAETYQPYHQDCNFNGSSPLLYNLAWKCKRMGLALFPKILERMHHVQRIEFTYRYHLYYEEFEQAFACASAMPIDGIYTKDGAIPANTDQGLCRNECIKQVIMMMVKKNKENEALALILDRYPIKEIYYNEDEIHCEMEENIAEQCIRLVLMQVCGKKGVKDAIELAASLPACWRHDAISHLIFRFTQPKRFISTWKTQAREFACDIKNLKIDVALAIRIFNDFPVDSTIKEPLKRNIETWRATHIIDALLEINEDERAKSFLTFLKGKSRPADYAGSFVHIYYPRVINFYYKNHP